MLHTISRHASLQKVRDRKDALAPAGERRHARATQTRHIECWKALMYHASLTNLSTMTYGILFEKIESGELPPSFYYAHVPALGLTTHGEGIEGARAAAEDLVKLWLTEKKAAGESVEAPSEVFFSTIEISESALQSA